MENLQGNKEDDSPPDDPHFNQIMEGLYLGNLSSALDMETIDAIRISHILTIETKPLPDYIISIPGITCLHIQVMDMPEEDLLSKFPQIIDFINDGRTKGNILVHCYYGMSRSATGVIAYLMKNFHLSVDEALHRVKLKRSIASPNSGFMKQLQLYERMNCHLDISNVSYKLYRLHIASNAIKKGNFKIDEFGDILSNKTEEIVIKCKKCRIGLFSKKSLILHRTNQLIQWHNLDEVSSNEEFCSQGFYTLPSPWMKDIFSQNQGKLLCPKCENKLGPFNWVEGIQCPCSTKIKPGFFIVPSRVDILPM